MYGQKSEQFSASVGGGGWMKTNSGNEKSRKQRSQKDGEGVNKERREERLGCICYY